jgi:hypothetical protein
MLMQFYEPDLGLALRVSGSNYKVDIDLIKLWEICTYIWNPTDELQRAAIMSEIWAMVAKNAYDPNIIKLPVICKLADYEVRSTIREKAIEKLMFGRIGPSVKEMEKAAENADLAAQILSVIRSISEAGFDGSVNKAVFVLDRVGVAGRTRLFKAWQTHKSVAHLKLAMIVAAQMGKRNPQVEQIRSRVETILGIAREIQTYAIANNHIPLNEIWEVPLGVGRDYEMDHFNLNDQAAAALKAYRAPQ